MPLSTDIHLPKSHQAKFPDRCVVCGCDNPNSNVRLFTGTLGWWTWLLWVFGKPFSVRAPACTLCGWRLQLSRLISLLVTIVIVIAAFAFVWPLISDQIPRAARRWVMALLALVSIVPQVIFETYFPHPFDITAYGEKVSYEFRDRETATEFAALNEDASWMEIE